VVATRHACVLVARHAAIAATQSLSPPFAANSKPLSAPARPLRGQRFGSRLRAAQGLTPQPQRKPAQLPRLIANRSYGPRSRRCLAAALAGRSGRTLRHTAASSPPKHRTSSGGARAVRVAIPSHLRESRQSLRTPRSAVAVRSLRFLTSTESAANGAPCRAPPLALRPRGHVGLPATRGAPDPARARPSPRVLVAPLLRAASRPCCGSLRAAWPSRRPLGLRFTAHYAVRSAYAGRRLVRSPRPSLRVGPGALRRRSASRCCGWLGPQSPPRHAGAKVRPRRGA